MPGAWHLCDSVGNEPFLVRPFRLSGSAQERVANFSPIAGIMQNMSTTPPSLILPLLLASYLPAFPDMVLITPSARIVTMLNNLVRFARPSSPLTSEKPPVLPSVMLLPQQVIFLTAVSSLLSSTVR